MRRDEFMTATGPIQIVEVLGYQGGSLVTYMVPGSDDLHIVMPTAWRDIMRFGDCTKRSEQTLTGRLRQLYVAGMKDIGREPYKSEHE